MWFWEQVLVTISGSPFIPNLYLGHDFGSPDGAIFTEVFQQRQIFLFKKYVQSFQQIQIFVFKKYVQSFQQIQIFIFKKYVQSFSFPSTWVWDGVICIPPLLLVATLGLDCLAEKIENDWSKGEGWWWLGLGRGDMYFVRQCCFCWWRSSKRLLVLKSFPF